MTFNNGKADKVKKRNRRAEVPLRIGPNRHPPVILWRSGCTGHPG